MKVIWLLQGIMIFAKHTPERRRSVVIITNLTGHICDPYIPIPRISFHQKYIFHDFFLIDTLYMKISVNN